MKWSNYNIEFEIDKEKIGIFNAYNRSFVVLEKNELSFIKQQILTEGIVKVRDAKYMQLLENNNIVSEEEDNNILNKIKFKSFRERFNEKKLELVIAPTADCNFACPYCFEKSKPQWYMDTKTTDNLLKFIKSFGNIPINILWFGGEPLLNFKKIEEISESLTELRIDFSASIITNGYLLNNSKINKLKKLHITDIQVTLDGSEETHNLHRPHKKGYKTFHKILSNLDNLIPYCIKNNIKVNIPVTVDSDNKKDFINIYNFLKKRY